MVQARSARSRDDAGGFGEAEDDVVGFSEIR